MISIQQEYNSCITKNSGYTKTMKIECKPFELLKEAYKYPVFKKIIESIPEEDHPLISCNYCDALEVTQKYMGHANNAIEETATVTALMALSGWRKTKQVFHFDEDFWGLLQDQGVDDKIPMEILYQLPYKNIYIEPLGVFVFFDRSFYTDGVEMKIVGFEDIRTLSEFTVVQLLPNHTLKECCEKIIEETTIKDNQKIFEQALGHKVKFSPEYAKAHAEFAVPIVQALLYLCAQNKDVEENPEQKKIHKKPTKRVKDQFKEVQKWDVGKVVVRNLKKDYRSLPTYQRETTTSGWTQRPHMRRAHWHHFWTGKRNGERKLILKWIAPTLINADKGEIAPTVNIIK